jgi:hypothetical protein
MDNLVAAALCLSFVIAPVIVLIAIAIRKIKSSLRTNWDGCLCWANRQFGQTPSTCRHQM